jgi:diguanylate cyclase (GGDEF)-like protein
MMYRQPTVLLAADNAEEIESMGELLQQEFNVLFARSGQQAINLATESDQIDLIVVDVDLPDIDGYEVCTRLKAQFTRDNLPMVMLGQDDDINKERGFDLGAADFIAKPFSSITAMARIKKQMELKIKTDLLTELAALDGLTCLANQDAFAERIDVEWRRATREYNVLAVLLINIDKFNAFNERYGYGVGDECLKKVARALEGSCSRAADMVSRLGSDEFAVLLPGNDLESALIVAERMCLAVKKLNVLNEFTTSGKLSVSVGVATIEPKQDDNYQQLVDEAEEMLFRARQLGGDQAQGVSV